MLKQKSEKKNVKNIKKGDIVIIRSEGNKSNNRDNYIVTELKDDVATCIKTKERSKGISYKVKLEDLYPIISQSSENDVESNSDSESSDTDIDENGGKNIQSINETLRDEENDSTIESILNEDEENIQLEQRSTRRSKPRIDYSILNKTGEKVRLRYAKQHCTYREMCYGLAT